MVVAVSSFPVESPFGTLTLATTATHLVALHFPGRTDETGSDRASGPPTALQAEVAAQLGAWFDGRLTRFDLPLDPAGTDFQRAAWRELCAIPFGETITYGEQARRIGRPTATRAIGAANGRNPIPIIVPCHRVVGADGSLTGFALGTDVKRRLLEHEGRVSAAHRGAA